MEKQRVNNGGIGRSALPAASVLLLVYAIWRIGGGVWHLWEYLAVGVQNLVPSTMHVAMTFPYLGWIAEAAVCIVLALLLPRKNRATAVSLVVLVLVWIGHFGVDILSALISCIQFAIHADWTNLCGNAISLPLEAGIYGGIALLSVSWMALAVWLFIGKKPAGLARGLRILMLATVSLAAVLVVLLQGLYIVRNVVYGLFWTDTMFVFAPESHLAWLQNAINPLNYGHCWPLLIAATGAMGAWLLKPYCCKCKKQEGKADANRVEAETETLPTDAIEWHGESLETEPIDM